MADDTETIDSELMTLAKEQQNAIVSLKKHRDTLSGLFSSKKEIPATFLDEYSNDIDTLENNHAKVVGLIAELEAKVGTQN